MLLATYEVLRVEGSDQEWLAVRRLTDDTQARIPRAEAGLPLLSRRRSRCLPLIGIELTVVIPVEFREPRRLILLPADDDPAHLLLDRVERGV